MDTLCHCGVVVVVVVVVVIAFDPSQVALPLYLSLREKRAQGPNTKEYVDQSQIGANIQEKKR